MALLILLIATPLPLTTAWSVAFYNSPVCSHDAGYYAYTSNNTISSCIKLFDDADDCTYFLGGGVEAFPCATSQMIYAEDLGMAFPAGTLCTLGSDDRCSTNPTFPAAGCANTPKGTDEAFDVPQLWFQCWDGP